ncbi:hypothetical protein VPH35_088073 [Triticum aestivum]
MLSEALVVLARVRSGGKMPSLSRLATLLRLLFCEGSVQAAWKVFVEMTAMGPRSSLAIFNGHCVFGRAGDAFELFDKMHKSGCEPTVFTYKFLVNARCHEFMMEARSSLDEMVTVGVEANTTTFNGIVARLLHFQHSFCLSIQVIKAVHLAHEQEELYEMSGSQISSDSIDMVICRLFGDGRLDDARHLVCSAVEQGVPVSAAGFNALIAAYSKGYSVGTSFTVYMDSSFRSGNVEDALKCWDDMVKVSVQPDFIAFSAYISGLCRLDYVNEAYPAFVEMLGHVAEALNLEQKMRQSGLVPDVFRSNILMMVFAQKEVHSSGLTPDVVTYNTIINAYCQVKTAMIFMNKMLADGCDPDIFTYINVFFSHFCNQGFGRRALVWAEKLRENSFAFDDATMNMLDWAFKEMEDGPQDSIADIDKCMFLEFLMLISYTTMSTTIKVIDPAGSNTIKVLDTG